MNNIMTKTMAIFMSALVATASLPTAFLPGSAITVQAGEADVQPATDWYSEDAESYEISTAADLMGLAQLVNEGNDFSGKTIKMTGNIDLSGIDNWTPIGKFPGVPADNRSFNGTFDGNGYTIRNFRIHDETDYTDVNNVNFIDDNYALFSYIYNATIKNLTVEGNINLIDPVNDIKVTNRGFTGGIIGYSFNSTVENCSFSGTINGGYEVGGIIGRGMTTTIKNCHLKKGSTVEGSYNVGGIAGRITSSHVNMTPSYIIDCSVDGTVQANIQHSGGIVGSTRNISELAMLDAACISYIDGCRTLSGSKVLSPDSSAGIVADSCSEIKNCANFAAVEKNSTQASDDRGAAGIVERQRVNVGEGIVNCMNYGSVSTDDETTAVGIANAPANLALQVKNVGNIARISSEGGQTCGLVLGGNASAALENSFNIGEVSGTNSSIISNRITDCTNVYYDSSLGESEVGEGRLTEEFANRTVVDLLNTVNISEEAEDTAEMMVWYQNISYPDLASNMVLVDDITTTENVVINLTKEDKTAEINAVISPENATNQSIYYTSSDTETATVDNNGIVTGVSEGQAVISVYALDSGREMATVNVTVTNVPEEPEEPSTSTQTPEETQPSTSTQTPEETQPSTSTQTPATATVGEKVSVGANEYVVTSVSAKTVAYTDSVKKKTSKITIPATIKIGNDTYKVTSVSKNALKNNKKLKTVVIGKNVTSIGKKAFFGCKNLKKITVKSKILKKVGAKAFKGINKKAVIKVPKKQLKKYKKLFKNKGQASSVVIR
ncbi:The GLUG motif protein [Eubacteriaceae bacterium CHKCI004]|nr:The GLUG motif protein [Eubacteriaceae bacterium CHKCI004]